MRTQAYEDRVVLIFFGLATAAYLALGIMRPFWPIVVGGLITFGALVMLIRARGTGPLRQSVWTTVGAISPCLYP